MGLTYARQTRPAPASSASTALFVDAGYVRRCAARSHQMISGSRISASRVSIDAGEITRFLDSLIVDFDPEAPRSRDDRRPGRRIYDNIGDDRRQRWRQLHYRSVVKGHGFVVRTVRAPRRPTNSGTVANTRYHPAAVEAALADDLVWLASGGLTTALLLAGGEKYATAMSAARELGADVLVLVPDGCGASVAKPLREAATRVIGLHPEVFEALFTIRDSRWRRRDARGSARSASVGAAR